MSSAGRHKHACAFKKKRFSIYYIHSKYLFITRGERFGIPRTLLGESCIHNSLYENLGTRMCVFRTSRHCLEHYVCSTTGERRAEKMPNVSECEVLYYEKAALYRMRIRNSLLVRISTALFKHSSVAEQWRSFSNAFQK